MSCAAIHRVLETTSWDSNGVLHTRFVTVNCNPPLRNFGRAGLRELLRDVKPFDHAIDREIPLPVMGPEVPAAPPVR